jgi:hypothetical protein
MCWLQRVAGLCVVDGGTDGREIAGNHSAQGATSMPLSTKEQQVLKSVLERSSADRAFRARLLAEPRAAIEEAFGVIIPPGFRVKFVEREPGVDALIVLPDLLRQEGELSDGELEAVAGGADEPSSSTWSDGMDN